MPASCEAAVSEDRLLDGRIRFMQPRDGFRSGIEPVLLAAAVPARSGERILEGGCGSGAGLLCLAARVAGIQGVGVERDAGLAALARANAAANGWPMLCFAAGDIAGPNRFGVFDHAFANPPYHAPEGTRSPQPGRDSAKRGGALLVAGWAAALGASLRHHGTLTFILPAHLLPAGLAALAAADCRARAVLPLWPRCGRPAKLVLLRGVRGGRSDLRLLSGLVLHDDSGAFTPAAQAVLRRGAALPMD
jgi:tRNA1Val (adenine37-N6)-methyltransferase